MAQLVSRRSTSMNSKVLQPTISSHGMQNCLLHYLLILSLPLTSLSITWGHALWTKCHRQLVTLAEWFCIGHPGHMLLLLLCASLITSNKSTFMWSDTMMRRYRHIINNNNEKIFSAGCFTTSSIHDSLWSRVLRFTFCLHTHSSVSDKWLDELMEAVVTSMLELHFFVTRLDACYEVLWVKLEQIGSAGTSVKFSNKLFTRLFCECRDGRTGERGSLLSLFTITICWSRLLLPGKEI